MNLTQRPHSEGRLRHRERAWLLPFGGLALSSLIATPLSDHGLSATQITSITFFVGVLSGIGWQVQNRRDFVDRFLGWAVMGALVMLLAASPNAEFDSSGGAAAVGPGVLAGVVIAEGWMRQKARP